MCIFKSAAIFILTILFLGCNAFAHKVNVFAYAEDGMVHTESYFSDGKKCVNSKIEIFNTLNNELLLTGKTDSYGMYSFKIPEAASIKVVLNAGMGHRNEYVIPESEVKEALGIQISEKAVKQKPEKPNQKTNIPSLRDVFAGIGYIFGIMGIAMYFRYKKKQ